MVLWGSHISETSPGFHKYYWHIKLCCILRGSCGNFYWNDLYSRICKFRRFSYVHTYTMSVRMMYIHMQVWIYVQSPPLGICGQLLEKVTTLWWARQTHFYDSWHDKDGTLCFIKIVAKKVNICNMYKRLQNRLTLHSCKLYIVPALQLHFDVDSALPKLST